MDFLRDDSWTRRGVTLLWDAEALMRIAHASQVVPLRRFLGMKGRWPNDLPASGGDALVVAGLDGCLDALEEQDAIQWLENDLRTMLLEFQHGYEGQAALVFWLPTGRSRLSMNPATEHYTWKCSTSHSGAELDIGRCLWSGAEVDLKRIIRSDEPNPDYDGTAWIGLFHPRSS